MNKKTLFFFSIIAFYLLTPVLTGHISSWDIELDYNKPDLQGNLPFHLI